MYPIIEKYIEGGAMRKDLCEEHSISGATFSYWLKKYRSDQHGDFMALSVGERNVTSVSVSLGHGTIHFASLPKAGYLRQLLLG